MKENYLKITQNNFKNAFYLKFLTYICHNRKNKIILKISLEIIYMKIINTSFNTLIFNSLVFIVL